MYKLALILFSFLFLVFPILAAPIQGGTPQSNTPTTGGNGGQAQQGATKDNSQQVHQGHFQQATTEGTSFTGTATTYTPGLGACGNTNSADQFVAAIPASIFNNGAHCNQSVQATVVDNAMTVGPKYRGFLPPIDILLTGQTGGSVSVTWAF
ncbi:hypothetical protein BGY98DRAFT_1025537 [Russula aff. rugulosa BPL654]|nr:hypothetical protein BGY98DRAFT_1025537 [Russula aff. rugulosa BPL654]